ncbi:MAG: class I SAM-dependent methyltransferase [Thiohalospira sp.]
MRLTAHVHQRLGALLVPGAPGLDATAGAGHDTLFLARALAPGPVHALDIQPAALERTRARLAAADAGENVTLHHASHSEPDRVLPAALRGRFAVALFNLGYLPGRPDGPTTEPVATLAALEAVSAWLAPEGLLSVVAYRGHPGGQAEAEAVGRWLEGHRAVIEKRDTGGEGPVWWLVRAPLASPP